MNITKHEFKKIVQSPVLLGFLGLCLAFNMLMIIGFGDNQYADFIADVSRETGVRMGPEFDERVRGLPPSLHTERLARETHSMIDVFDGYTTDYIAERYIGFLALSGLTADIMEQKYQRLQYAVDAHFEAGDGMDVYFAESTYWRHRQLFDVMMGALLFQGILIAALIMLLSLGYEYSAKTEFMVYATKTGRRVNHAKFIAAVTSALVAYAILAAITLTVYLALNPMGGVWESSVSSGFNFVRSFMIARPFVTWHGLTVFTYFLASIGISFGLVLCFALMGYIIGSFTNNSYIGFIGIFLFNFALLILPNVIFGATIPTFILAYSPIWLVFQRGMWFTDGGSNILWAHFETVGVLVSLVILAALCVVSWRQFKRRNLA
jgi:ABC-type transport system involved in multi-copper enzyme maturation permease subunit